MISIGAVFRTDSGNFVHLYTDVPEYRHAFPGRDEKSARYLGYAVYRKGLGGQKRRLDIYQVSEIPFESIDVRRDLVFNDSMALGKEYDPKKSIFYFLSKGLDEKTIAQIQKNVRADVDIYSNDKTASITKPGDSIDCFCDTPQIIKRPAEITGGKADFNTLCLTGQYNLDWSFSCISHLIPPTKAYPHLSWSPKLQCSYCYAARNNWPPLRIRSFDEKFLEEMIKADNIKIIRVGKVADQGHRFFYEHNMQLLQLAEKLNFRVLIVTKFLDFDKNMTKMLKKTNSTVQFSLGYDSMEPGAVIWGCTNEFRIENALRYKDAGVNSVCRLVREAPIAPDNQTLEIIANLNSHNIPVLLTPLRIPGRSVSEQIGRTWGTLKKNPNQMDFFGQDPDQGTYIQEGSNSLLPRIIHPDYKVRIGDNNSQSFRVCGHIGDNVLCGSCFMDDGKMCDAKSARKQVDYSKKPSYSREKKNRGQKKLFSKK